MRSTGSFILGALLGGLIGATVAIVLAPTSGVKLREQIRDYAGNVQNQISQAATTRRAQLEEQIAQMRAGKMPQSESGPSI